MPSQRLLDREEYQPRAPFPRRTRGQRNWRVALLILKEMLGSFRISDAFFLPRPAQVMSDSLTGFHPLGSFPLYATPALNAPLGSAWA